MDSVIVIFGPTASGKTRISIELAGEINGEIISADSMQIYKHMDIGAAKPDKAEMKGIKHYLVDEVNPDEEFSVARYKELAYGYIDKILAMGKIPVITGGAGLYINSLVYNIDFSETIIDWKLRERLRKEAQEFGNKHLHDRLVEVDPDAAGRIHENDIKRVIRALEVYEYTKKTITQHQAESRNKPPKYDFILIGINTDRQKLYDRINHRVDLMMDKGLVCEVNRLVEMGYDKSSIAMQGLGYKEILSYLKGEITREEALYIIKRDTRHYAKRQITWFKRLENVYWFDPDKFECDFKIVENIKYYIARHGIIL